MRDSDSRSSISRAMRVACPCMMARNFSRAAGSSLAVPCSVSMKPSSAASGVRSSWLALAMKSARISSTRRSGREIVERHQQNVGARVADVASRTGVTKASNQRSSGTRSKNSTRCGVARWRWRAGSHRPVPACARRSSAGSPRRSAGAMAEAAALKAMTRPSRSSTIAGPGKPADQLLDQQRLRMRGGAAAIGKYRAAGPAARARPAEQRQPRRRAAGSAKPAPRGKLRAVVFARHGQPASVFSVSISLRIGAVAADRFQRRLRPCAAACSARSRARPE